MRKYTDVLYTILGTPLAGASVDVYNTGTTTPATLYSDDGVTSTANPLTTDASGTFAFYVEDGRYDIRITGTGVTTKLTTDIEIFDNKSRPTVYAHMQTGTDMGAKILAAINLLPTTGGIVDCRGLEGAQTWSTSLGQQTKHLVLLLGASTITVSGTNTLLNFGGLSGSDYSLKVHGVGNATKFIVPGTGPYFNGNGRSTYWQFADFLVQYSGSTSSGSTFFNTNDFGVGSTNFSDGRFLIERVRIQGFDNGGLSVYTAVIGKSTYPLTIKDCHFEGNTNSITFSDDCEFDMSHCVFGNLPTSAQVQVAIAKHSTSHIRDCDFECNNASATSSVDIFCNVQSGNGGYVWITDNKFGAEGDSSSRKKIRFQGSASRSAINYRIERNNFNGVAGMTCIDILSPVELLKINDNNFNTFGTLVNDGQTIYAANGAFGHGQFLRNTVIHDGTFVYTVFNNGGRGFKDIDWPQSSADLQARHLHTHNEAPELRNRLTRSEAFDLWSATNVSVTTGQTDPFGTTRACLLTKGNVNTSENIGLSINNSSMGTQLVVSFWAKAGTAGQALIYLENATKGLPHEERMIKLTSGWERYIETFSGIYSADSYNLRIYPEGHVQSAHTMSIFGAQVSDWDSPYLLTTGSATSTIAYGDRHERGIQLGATANLTMSGSGILSMGTTGTVITNPAITMTGATPSVAAGNNFFVNNGGSTTVTSFTGGTSGQYILLLGGNANTTIQNNASIKLKGAVDAVLPSNGIMTLFFTSVWTEVSRNF